MTVKDKLKALALSEHERKLIDRWFNAAHSSTRCTHQVPFENVVHRIYYKRTKS